MGGMGSGFRESRDKAQAEWEKQKAARDEDERRAAEERSRWERQKRAQAAGGPKSKDKSSERPSSYRSKAGSEDAQSGTGPSDEAPRPPPLKRPVSSGRAAYLELLGFERNTDPTEEELKKAYRAMAMRWHPDRPHNRERQAEATEMFQAAKEAYDYFYEEHKRKT